MPLPLLASASNMAFPLRQSWAPQFATLSVSWISTAARVPAQALRSASDETAESSGSAVVRRCQSGMCTAIHAWSLDKTMPSNTLFESAALMLSGRSSEPLATSSSAGPMMKAAVSRCEISIWIAVLPRSAPCTASAIAAAPYRQTV